MRRHVTASLAIASVLSLAAPACAPEPVAPAPPPQHATTTSIAVDTPPPARPDGRLTVLATPTHYALALDLDPTKERYSGRVSIDVEVPKATRFLVLHGRKLAVKDVAAKVGAGAGGRSIAGEAAARLANGSVEPEEIVLTFAEPIPAGKATIAIGYDAPFSDDLYGAYRVKDGDRWYAFTQFESTAARRAFPCFDEPALKATFDLSIVAPAGMIAVANAPETKRAPAKDGRQATQFDFATTPAISTYLLAFAVGDLDVREGVKAPVPIRLITTKGKSAIGGAALDSADALVRALGEYFGVPYPFGKLDLVAVPDFGAGAMENPGLVTFREELLLQDPKHPSVRGRRMSDLVIAHELAHQWFGDLVTMQWWNDVWLNEGFATWMEAKVVDGWKPEYGLSLEAVADAEHVMDEDALNHARAVRQPVASTSEIEEAFDGISYQKGSAVLSMLESWLGPVAFQRGVRDYIRGHEWKNATADDLLASLGRASGRDVAALAATFLDRPGVPTVTLKGGCEKGKLSYDLTQAAWHPLGVEPKPTDATPWRIPVCLDAAGEARGACGELADKTGPFHADVAKCGAWTYPNAGGRGYYRWSMGADAVRAMARDVARLPAADRIGFLSNAWAQVRSGELAPDVFFDAVAAYDHETDPHVLGALVSTLYDVDRTLIDDDTRAPFRAWVAKRLVPHTWTIGWQKMPHESDTTSLLRPQLLRALGDLARDPGTMKQADLLAKRWLADHGSVDADVARAALHVSTIAAGPSRIDELRVAAKDAKTPLDRIAALSALASFDDEATLKKALDVILTDEIKMQDVRYVMGRDDEAVHRRPKSSRVVFEWLAAHWPQVQKKLPGHLAGRMVHVIGGACTEQQRDAERAFFEPKVKELEGSARPFAESSEAATSCSAVHARSAGAVGAYFKR